MQLMPQRCAALARRSDPVSPECPGAQRLLHAYRLGLQSLQRRHALDHESVTTEAQETPMLSTAMCTFLATLQDLVRRVRTACSPWPLRAGDPEPAAADAADDHRADHDAHVLNALVASRPLARCQPPDATPGSYTWTASHTWEHAGYGLQCRDC